MIAKLTALKNHAGFIRYFKNTSWMMAEQFLRIIAGLLVGIWVARFLGPEQFGLFSYVLAFTAIFGGIAKLGLDGIMVRELINHPEKRDTYLGTAFWLKVLGAFLVMGIMAAIVPFTSNDATTNTFIFIIAAGLVFQSFEVVEFYFQSQVLAKIVSICKVIQLALSSMIKIYLVLNEAELIWFVLVTLFDTLSLAISYAIAYKLHKNPAFYKHFDFNLAKQLLKDSWPLIFSSIVVMIYMRIDQIMIKEMLGEYEVGIYSAAVRLSEAFYFIPMLITASLFPAILNAKNQSEELYKQRLQRLYTFMVWIAIVIALALTFSAEVLIALLFGNAYQAAAEVLVVHAWAAVFVFLGVAFSKHLVAENLTKIMFQRTLLGAVANILLNLWLIPLHGLIGAAMATLLAQFIANYVYDFFDKRLYGQILLKTKAFFMPWLIIVR
ncbi:MAG: flippase [Thiotrichales bacterium]|jgi:O-antigen/teichoic acid export membrane protein|nr:flippase [Thiotrichales bacterium]